MLEQLINKAVEAQAMPYGWGEQPEAYHRFLFYLAQQMQPERCLELGVKFGNGVGHLAKGCPAASVIGVDIRQQAANGLPRNVTIVQQDSVEYLKSCKGRLFDIIHIDTEHTPTQANREFVEAMDVIRTPGFICVDDVLLSDDMRNWWDDTKHRSWLWDQELKYHISTSLHFSGFGIVEVT